MKHHAWTANVPGVGELEERDPGDYVGRHRCQGYQLCLHAIPGDPPYLKRIPY